MQVRVNSPVTGVNDANGEDAVIEAGVVTVEGVTSTVGDATATGNVLSNDTDPDLYPVADTSELEVIGLADATFEDGVFTVAGSYGTLSLNEDGSWTYTLDPALSNGLAEGDEVTEEFTYTVSDPDGETDTAVLTITIAGSNDAPVITSNAAAASGAVTENSAPTATGTLTSSDVDAGATATWSVSGTGSYGGISINRRLASGPTPWTPGPKP